MLELAFAATYWTALGAVGAGVVWLITRTGFDPLGKEPKNVDPYEARSRAGR